MTNEKPARKPRAPAAVSRRRSAAASSTPPAEAVGSVKPKGKVRLQRALASAGYGSRRQCEELIIEGRVLVDGKIVTELGVSVEPAAQKIFVDGTPLRPRKLVYYALNKPTGVVTTNVDPEGRPRVIDLVPPDERVFPVGRLDRSSEGLILLTNDGELAQRLAHPRYEVQKVYRVTVAGKMDVATMRQMERGIHIAEGMVKVEGARILRTRGRATEMEITLKEGKNREIRRILARLGHKVQQLKRIAIGPLRLGEMPTGAYRKLSFEELKKLKTSVAPSTQRRDEDESTDADTGSPRRGRDGTQGPARKGAQKSSESYRGGPRKKFAKKTTVAHQGAGKVDGDSRRPAGGKPAAAGRPYGGKPVSGRRPLPKRKAALEISTDRVVTGSIIGADPVPAGEDRPARRKKATKKKVSTTRSFGRGTKKRPQGHSRPDAAKKFTTTKRARDSRKDD